MFTEEMMIEEMMNFVELDDAEMEEVSGGKKANYMIEGVNGKSFVRKGPGLYYKSIGTLHKGEQARYLGKSSIDEDGRKWYKIDFYGKTGWVSFRYTAKVKF